MAQRPDWAAPPLEEMLSKAELDAVEYDVTCAECGSKMALRFADWNGEGRQPFYGCSQFPDCQGRHGAHPSGKPLGTPGNQATRTARVRAHAGFDQLWEGKHAAMDRSEAYAWMRGELGFSHIGEMTVEQCEELIKALDEHFDIDPDDAN